MRRHDIFTGILLILSIIDIALAAPLSVQEKRQARIVVANAPKRMTTVLRKRWEEEIEKLGEEYFETSGKPVGSSESQSSSSSAPSVPDHASTNIVPVRPPALDRASSTTNPDPSMDPSCPPSCSSSTSSGQGLSARGGCFSCFKQGFRLLDDYLDPFKGPRLTTPLMTLSDYGSDFEWTAAKEDNVDWDYLLNLEDKPSPPSPKKSVQVYKPPPLPSSSGHGPGPPPPKEMFSWPVPEPTDYYSFKVVPLRSPSSGTESPPELEHDWEAALEPPTEPELDLQAVPGPVTSPDLPGLRLDHQSLSTGVQPADLQDFFYKVKGKAPASRRNSGTARDVGTAAQSELNTAETSLGPGE